MRVKDNSYILNGPIFKSILTYAVPIMVGALIQNLFHSADMMVLGNMADDVAVASVGATATVIGLVVTTCVALATGTNVVLSRALGAGDKNRVNSVVDTSMMLSLVIGIIVAAVGNIVAEPLLRLLSCPADCYGGAVLYLRIIFFGAPAQLIYNFGSAVIRSEGDSRSPLTFIITAGIVNVVLNVVLCLVLEQKVAAVAIATVVSNVIGAVLVMLRLTRGAKVCKFHLKSNAASLSTFAHIMRFAIPSAVTSAIYPIASLQIQSAVNSFGSACVAGAAAATNIESFISALQGAFTATLVTFASHNIGAGNHPRLKKTILYSGASAVLVGCLGTLAYYFAAEELLSLFLPGQAEAIFYGVKRMQYVCSIYWLSALNGTLASCIQAFGYPVFSTVNSLVSVLGFRIVWMNFIYDYSNPSIDMLYLCFSCSWVLYFILSAAIFIAVYLRYIKRIRRAMPEIA